MSTSPLRREILSHTRVLDESKGLVQYVASDQSLDSYQEVILASGWRFSLFGKNAPFVDSHDYSSIEKLLGRVVDFRVEDSRLVETVQWAHDVPENALARLGWKMTLAGHLRAVSVGFVPRRVLSGADADPAPYREAVRRLGMEARPPVRVYAEQEQIELSACLIGANPNALAQARAAGAIDDRDLASVGIGADGALLLRETGLRLAGNPGMPPAVRLAFAARLRSLLSPEPRSEPFFPGRSGEDRSRARRKFLRALSTASATPTEIENNR